MSETFCAGAGKRQTEEPPSDWRSESTLVCKKVQKNENLLPISWSPIQAQPATYGPGNWSGSGGTQAAKGTGGGIIVTRLVKPVNQIPASLVWLVRQY